MRTKSTTWVAQRAMRLRSGQHAILGDDAASHQVISTCRHMFWLSTSGEWRRVWHYGLVRLRDPKEHSNNLILIG